MIGHSVQGRPIVAYRIGDPYSTVKAVILGQMHGNEPAGTVVARAIIALPRAVLGADVWVVPTMNPDGAAHGTRQNAHGVDLNRNWPDHWRRLTGQFYSGPKALSEPETRAMYAFLSRVRPKFLISMHQPLNGMDTTDGGRLHPRFVAALAKRLGLTLKPFTCGGFCYGSMTGWVTDNQRNSIAVTIEFPASPSADYLKTTARSALLSAIGTTLAAPSVREPRLHVDSVTVVGRTAVVTGWAFDPDARSRAINVAFYDDGRKVVARPTESLRADVNKAYGLTGRHGFTFNYKASAGSHRICVQAGNVGAGVASPQYCTSVAVS
ncbi:DUF2817 domain-containing protein [Jatrophihabitans telluris]|uniref:DUF2817 domain-containing protein n=1 Tax=Jatrophihabitans telluris TaxID=2038343 RepID=A0ABY4QV90_9ACTN|nr:M14 family zinc carboxypeptidase [Jatrophihabitans telluris]UQX87224.1 DUF2817 domain-containing protein [Jatrophihabitans telluris]